MQDIKPNILIIDISGEIISSDNYDILQYLKQKSITKFWDLIPENLKEKTINIISQVKSGKLKIRMPETNVLIGNIEYYVNNLAPCYNNIGEIKQIAIHLSEISTKKDISTNENMYESLFNNAHDAIFVTDIEGKYLEVNDKAIQRTGFSREQFLKLNIKNMPLSGRQIPFNKYFQEILLKKKSTANINYIHKNGSIVETEISGKLFNYPGQEAILHISRDISERNKSHAIDIDTVLKGEEKERSAFAGQINDIVGANLSLLKMYIEAFLNNNDNDAREKTSKKINTIIDSSLIAMSEISNKISPHVLKNLGIKAALEVFIEKTQNNFDIQFITELNIPDRIPESKTVTLYRIIIEIINNITKHSMAQKAIIYADATEEWLFFEIKDNGKGFDFENKLIKKDCIGLLNIFNKTKSINGIIDYISVLDKGTAIKLKVPINE